MNFLYVKLCTHLEVINHFRFSSFARNIGKNRSTKYGQKLGQNLEQKHLKLHYKEQFKRTTEQQTVLVPIPVAEYADSGEVIKIPKQRYIYQEKDKLLVSLK